MPIVTYIAPQGSDGREMVRWLGNKVNVFVNIIPERCSRYLTQSDLPAILIEGGWPYRSEYLSGDTLLAGVLLNTAHRFLHEETEHKTSLLPKHLEFS